MSKFNITLAIGLLLAILLPILSACGGQPATAAGAVSGKNLSGTVKQTTIQATVSGDTVTIPAADLDKYGNVNFRVNTANDYYMFMAYQYGDQTYVRADVCVPCGSESFTLKNGTLVCDSCGTVFDVKTGAGSGASRPARIYQTAGGLPVDWQYRHEVVGYGRGLSEDDYAGQVAEHPF